MSGGMRADAHKRDPKSLRRGAGVMPSPGGDATTPAAVALTDDERDRLAREVLGGASPSPLMVRAVERIIAARLVAAGVVSDAAAEVPVQHGVAWQDRLNIICLCGEVCTAVVKRSVAELNRSYVDAPAAEAFARHLRAAAAASRADADEGGA